MPDSAPMPDAASVDRLHASGASAFCSRKFDRKCSSQILLPLLWIKDISGIKMGFGILKTSYSLESSNDVIAL